MFIEAIRAKIIRIHRDLEIDGEQYITAQMVLDRYLGRGKPERVTIIDLFLEHNEMCHKLSGNSMAPATVKRYENHSKAYSSFYTISV